MNARSVSRKTAAKPAVPAIQGIKGFDGNLACRGFQYEVGKTFKHDGQVRACSGGLHCITGHPLAVFDYYAPAGSRFCRVEISGATHSDDGTKTAAEIMAVGQEIGITDLVNDAVAWVLARSHPEGESATGYQGAASATGDQGAASATGYRGAASATGYQGAAMAAGYAGRVMGALGNALFAVERTASWEIVSVAAGIVGLDGLKADVWYVCRDGALVEAA